MRTHFTREERLQARAPIPVRPTRVHNLAHHSLQLRQIVQRRVGHQPLESLFTAPECCRFDRR